MNLNHQPPSTPFQHWGLMLCMTGFFGLIGSAALLYISWSWLSDWGTFLNIGHTFGQALKRYFSGSSLHGQTITTTCLNRR